MSVSKSRRPGSDGHASQILQLFERGMWFNSERPQGASGECLARLNDLVSDPMPEVNRKRANRIIARHETFLERIHGRSQVKNGITVQVEFFRQHQ